MAVATTFLLYLVISQCVSAVLGIVIDPQSLDNTPAVFTHCLTNNDVIQIKDPFMPSRYDDDKFIAMEWYHYNKTHETELLWFLKSKTDTDTHLPKISKFQFWGLQINNVNHRDSGTYTAKLKSMALNEDVSFQVDVATPPVLTSDRLSMTRNVNNIDQSVTLSCGQIADLGSPPISIKFKAENGTLLPAVYSNGFFQLKLTSQEADSDNFKCEIDTSASAARCIDSKDMSRWQGAISGTSGKSTSAGSGKIGIIVGAAAGVVVLTIIIIIIFVIVVKRKKAKTYNTKVQEEKRENDFNENKSTPLLSNDKNHYETPSVTKAPIYKGPSAPGPYMVSRLSQGMAKPNSYDPDAEYEEMNCGYNEKSPSVVNSGIPYKKREEKDKSRREKDGRKEDHDGKDRQNPPRTKPRSIFLTPSMEELDKIGKAVAGGEGSGASPLGTQV